ncbi:kinase-like domain-containing protein [Aspergillus californicus]
MSSLRFHSAYQVGQSPPINDNPRYRYATLLAGSVLMLTDQLCASTMRFISQHTTIPVPKVVCAFTYRGCTYIVMERIKGQMLGVGWVYRNEESKTKLLSQLQQMVQEMRKLPPPSEHLRHGMEFDSRLDNGVQELIKQHGGDWPMVFTHGDLSSLNVLVRGDTIVGIIDWETSGWYPSYWEYTTACQSFLVEEIDKFLHPMPEELSMDRARQRYFVL